MDQQAVHFILDGQSVFGCLVGGSRIREHKITEVTGQGWGRNESVLVVTGAKGQDVGGAVLPAISEVEFPDRLVVGDQQSHCGRLVPALGAKRAGDDVIQAQAVYFSYELGIYLDA